MVEQEMVEVDEMEDGCWWWSLDLLLKYLQCINVCVFQGLYKKIHSLKLVEHESIAHIMHEESADGNGNMSEILLQKWSNGKTWQWNDPNAESRQQTPKLMQELEICVFCTVEGSLPQVMVLEGGSEAETTTNNLMVILFLLANLLFEIRHKWKWSNIQPI